VIRLVGAVQADLKEARGKRLQPFSQKPRTPIVTQLLQIGVHGVAEADL